MPRILSPDEFDEERKRKQRVPDVAPQDATAVRTTRVPPAVQEVLRRRPQRTVGPASSFAQPLPEKDETPDPLMTRGVKVAAKVLHELGPTGTMEMAFNAGRKAHRAVESSDIGKGAVALATLGGAAIPESKLPARALKAIRKVLGKSDVAVDATKILTRQEPAGTKYTAPIDEGTDPRMANVSKFGFSPEGEAKWREIVGQMDIHKKSISVPEQVAEAHKRAVDPAGLMRQPGQWDGMDALAARQFQSEASERLAALSRELQSGMKTPDEAQALKGEIGRLTDDISILAARGVKERSAAGRNLAAYKIVATNTMDQATWQTLAQRAKGELPLTSDEILKVRELTGKNSREELVQFVSSLHKSSNLEKGLTLWKAGLLTSPTTHLANVVGNTTMAALETAKEPLAVGIDAIISLARGAERTKAMPAGGLIAGQLRALPNGVREAAKVFKTGITPEEAAKWDFRRTNFDNAFFQSYTDVVFDALAAEDRPFRAMATARALGEHVTVRAKQMKKADPSIDLQATIDGLMKQPPNDLMVQAIADAEIATFQNRGTLARKASALKSGDSGAVRFLTETTMPFTQTPSNVATRLLDYSPLGVITAAIRQTSNPSQKRLAEDLARSATGSGFVALGFILAQQGIATGASPMREEERNLWELEGKQANSIRIGDKWVNISRLSPGGMLIALGAQFQRVVSEHGADPAKAIGGMAGAAGRVVTDQSFLKGVSGSLQTLNDPVRYGGNMIDNLGRSMVPSVVGRVAQAIDPVKREADGFVEGIQSRIPGASKSLPAKLNAFGEAQERPGGLRPMVDFLGSTDAHSSAVIDELRKYEIGIGGPSKQRKPRGEKIDYTPDERREALAAIGPARAARLARVIASPEYFKASDDSKRRRLTDALEMEREKYYAQDDARRRKAKSPPQIAAEP